MSGIRLAVGVVVMGFLVPLTLSFLFGLRTPSQLFTVAACTLLPWGIADLLAGILERPRLADLPPLPTAILEERTSRQDG